MQLPTLNIKTRILVAVVVFEVVAYSTIQLFNSYMYRKELFAMMDSQISETIISATTRVTAISTLMEKNALALALAGEQMYHQKQAGFLGMAELDNQVEQILVKNFSAFPEALGGGIWYEPYALDEGLHYYGPYAFRNGEQVEFSWDLNTPEYDYPNQAWYVAAFDTDSAVKGHYFRPVIWTAPYFDEAGTFSLMMTVDAVMQDNTGNIIGLSTVDWGLSELTSFLSGVRVTPNSVPFFIHRNSGLFLSYPKDPQKVMQRVDQFRWGARILMDDGVETLGRIKRIMLEGTEHDIYYYTTKNGFVFGTMLPRSDLEHDINEINSVTLIAGFLIGTSFIVLMMLIMRILFSPFDKVLDLIKRSVRRDEYDDLVEISRIEYRSRNEFTPIIRALNDVNKQVQDYLQQIVSNNEQLQISKNQINALNTELEKKVALRTEQLEQKTQEAIASLELLKTTQNQCIENEKHAALGRLVAGVAHEINTPLGVAVTASTTLESVMKQMQNTMRKGKLKRSEFDKYCSRLDECLTMLNANLKRSADLVLSFKQIAVEQSTADIKAIDLNEFLKNLVKSIQPQYQNCQQVLEFHDSSQGVTLHCNAVALTQVITNLVMNALVHGLGDKKDGKTVVALLVSSEQVTISVHDNGKGMAKEVQECIFDPFFTTSRNSGATGLGLHIVYNLVVQQMSGSIDCQSTQGVGTVFSVTLPIMEV